MDTPLLQPLSLSPTFHTSQDLCYGVFTFRPTTANAQQHAFMTFMDRSVLFATFTATLPWGTGNTYSYFYGVGLK